MKTIFFILVFIGSLNANVNVVCKAGIMDNNSAKLYIDKLLVKEPENIECILKLANIHLKSGELLRGYKLISRAYDINPLAIEESKISNILPDALKMTRLARLAKKNSDKLLWNELGDDFYNMGVFNEASKIYEKSLKIDSKQPYIGLKLALSYKKSNQIDNAVERLFILVEQDEKDFYANYYLGKFLRYFITDDDSAIKYFTSAKEILLLKQEDFTSLEFSSFMNDINMELGK